MKRFKLIIFLSLLVIITGSCGKDVEKQDETEATNNLEQTDSTEEQMESKQTESAKRNFYMEIKDATHATVVITGLTLSPEVFNGYDIENSAVYNGVLYVDRYGIQFSYEQDMENEFRVIVFDTQDADGIMEAPVELEAGFGENIIVIEVELPSESTVDFGVMDGIEYRESLWIDGSTTQEVHQDWFEINENSAKFPEAYYAYLGQNEINEQAQNELMAQNETADMFLQDLYSRGIAADTGNNDLKMAPLTDDYMVYIYRNDEGNEQMEYREYIHVMSFDEKGDLIAHITRILDQPLSGEATVCMFSRERFLSLQDYKQEPLLADKIVAYEDYLRYKKGLDTQIVYGQQSIFKEVFMSNQEIKPEMFVFSQEIYQEEDFPQIEGSQVPMVSDDFVIFTSKTENGTPKTEIYFFEDSLISVSMTTIYEYATPQQATAKMQENKGAETNYDSYETNGKYLYITRSQGSTVNKYPVLYQGTYSVPSLSSNQINEYLNTNLN